MDRFSTTGSLVLALALLAGCNITPHYDPPVATTPESVATLVGSKNVDANFFKDDVRAFFTHMDGETPSVFLSARSSWDEPTTVFPGRHVIRVCVEKGRIDRVSAAGCSEVVAVFDAAHSYTIRAGELKPTAERGQYTARFWIECSDGTFVSDVVEQTLYRHGSTYVPMPITKK
jgi:hypothetical protein